MRIPRMIVVCVFVLVFPAWAGAQSTFGGSVGVVKDPGQGAVPNAHLKLTNLDDHTQRDSSTDTNGGFEFVNLRPGHYELFIHADGFADFKMTALQLDARQTLRAEAQLKLATSSQTVEVEGDSGPVINTENATIGDSKDFQQITSLPVNYRGATTSPPAMLATVPGAQQDANGNVSVGGGLPSQVQYSVDGSSTVNIRQNGALGNMNPSTELIGEFKVTQFNNNAEFAQLGDVTISTKSGTEHFHGSAFEYSRNDALDAEVWNSGDKPHKVFNTFGGSLGGPVKLPKLTRGLSQTFFFADFEANRRRLSTPLFLFVPTAAMRSGDFSALSTPLMDPQVHSRVFAFICAFSFEPLGARSSVSERPGVARCPHCCGILCTCIQNSTDTVSLARSLSQNWPTGQVTQVS
jgi:Carboxypeptidase regulatory-like domain